MTPEIENLLIVAHKLGCDEEQIKRFLRYRYVPLPRALEFHKASREVDKVEGQAMVGYGGPRGEAKSHAIIAQVALDDCYRMPGLKCLYLRKVKASAKEQLTDLTDQIIGIVPKNNIIRIGNSSTILIGGFRDKAQLNSILGLQYDVIIAEDATTFDADDIKKIRGSCRTSKLGWKPRLYMPSNPGGIGHAWYKKMFWDTWQANKEINTRFVWARPGDNPFIDKGYREYLDGLTGWLRQAWRDGDFSIAAGQFFTPFSYEHHVIKPKFSKVPEGWPVWGSLDYGYVHPTVYQLHTTNDGVIYTVDELWRQRYKAEDNAIAIREMWAKWGVHPRLNVAGHDIFHTEDDAPMIADRYKKVGIRFEKATINRVNGWAEVMDRLGDPINGVAPKWQIFNTCTHLIECIPMLQHNPNRAEDVIKVDVNETGGEGDDSGDCARYGLMVKRRAPRGILSHGKTRGWQ